MPKKEEKKKPKSIDDFFDELKNTHTKDLDAAFKSHDEFNKIENMNHWYNHVLAPSQDDLYNTIKSELDKAFGKDDTKKLSGKKKELEKAVAVGLKKYFEKAQPSVIKTLKNMKMDEDEEFDYLVRMYDDHVGAGQIEDVDSIKKTIDSLLKDKRVTVGHAKRRLYEQKPKHAEAALSMLRNRHMNQNFGKFHSGEIAAYLKPKLEKEGLEIEDKLAYATSNIGNLLGMREAYLEKKAHPYLKKKEEKKK